jgi:hypothetical protein
MKNLSRRHIVIGGAVVVAVTAFAASADTLAGLGTAVGWHGKLSWSLPVAVDVLALVALVAWFTPGVTGLGKRVTVGGVVASIVLNAVGHLVGAGHLTPGPVLVVAVSAVPVISMALAAHLAVEVTRPVPEAKTTAPERDTQVSPTPQPAPAPAPVKPQVICGGHLEIPAVPPRPRLDTEAARAAIEQGWRNGWSIRHAAKVATRAPSQVQRVYAQLDEMDQKRRDADRAADDEWMQRQIPAAA